MNDEYLYDAIDILKKLISIPSSSRNEDQVADVLAESISKYGFKPIRDGNNVWCLSPSFNSNIPTILLNSHLDTVKPVDGWKIDPYSPIEEDGCIFGLGSNDAGAPLVSLLMAFVALNKKVQPFNLVYLASCEEEIGGKNGIESVIDKLPKIDVAIVGEPTNMNPAIAEKGLMVLDGKILGISGHAARNEGENAIYKAVDVINALRKIHFEKESALLGPVKITITQIEAGYQHNIIPDLCKIVVDVRTTDAYSNQETLELIRKAVPDCSLTPRSTRLNSSKIHPDHPLVQRLEIVGKKPFGSPTLSDQALMPFPSLKLGPGDSARSHTANEYIKIEEIREGIELYVKILDGIRL